MNTSLNLGKKLQEKRMFSLADEVNPWLLVGCEYKIINPLYLS